MSKSRHVERQIKPPLLSRFRNTVACVDGQHIRVQTLSFLKRRAAAWLWLQITLSRSSTRPPPPPHIFPTRSLYTPHSLNMSSTESFDVCDYVNIDMFEDEAPEDIEAMEASQTVSTIYMPSSSPIQPLPARKSEQDIWSHALLDADVLHTDRALLRQREIVIQRAVDAHLRATMPYDGILFQDTVNAPQAGPESKASVTAREDVSRDEKENASHDAGAHGEAVASEGEPSEVRWLPYILPSPQLNISRCCVLSRSTVHRKCVQSQYRATRSTLHSNGSGMLRKKRTRRTCRWKATSTKIRMRTQTMSTSPPVRCPPRLQNAPSWMKIPRKRKRKRKRQR